MATKDIYLLMRPELIRATLKGQKWQTRRLCKLHGILPEFVGQPGEEDQPIYWEFPGLGLGPYAEEPVDMDWLIANPHTGPYGKPGDLAVVRESFRIGQVHDGNKPSEVIAKAEEAGYRNTVGPVWYEADGAYSRWGDCDNVDFNGKGKLRGPYEMPRCVARIVRPITKIRVERVADISEADAEAEGVYHDYNLGELARYRIRWPLLSTGQCLYHALWNEINAKPKPRYGREGGKKVITHYEAFPWSEEDFDALYPGAREAGTWKGKPLTVYPNPFVWCISFERREEAPHAS